jgi:hypothetical protein
MVVLVLVWFGVVWLLGWVWFGFGCGLVAGFFREAQDLKGMPFEVEGGGGGLEYDGGGGGGLEDEGGVGGGGFEGQLGYRLHTWISAPQPGYRFLTWISASQHGYRLRTWISAPNLAFGSKY